MNKKLPPEAYAFYVSLGQDRSYEAVAAKYDVCERAVADKGKREHWQERIAEQEKKARERVDEQAVETLAQMSNRHLKVLKFIQAKAIETIKSTPLDSCMDAVKAFALSIEKERLIRGEPTERTAMDIEKKIREEHERWLVPADQPKGKVDEGDREPAGEPGPMSEKPDDGESPREESGAAA